MLKVIRTLADLIIISGFLGFCYMWFTHGASIQGIYDSHVFHLKEAETGGLERIRQRTNWYQARAEKERLARLEK